MRGVHIVRNVQGCEKPGLRVPVMNTDAIHKNTVPTGTVRLLTNPIFKREDGVLYMLIFIIQLVEA